MSNEKRQDQGGSAADAGGAGGDPFADRRAKLAKLRDELKIDPFGQRTEGLITLADAAAKYDAAADEAHRANSEHDRRPVVKISGRVMLHRVMGNLIFITLRDATGDLQIAVSKKAVDTQSFQVAKLTDLGDIVVAQGPLAKTKTGEITVWARSEGQGPGARGQGKEGDNPQSTSRDPQSPGPWPLAPGPFSIACKSMVPPPGKWHGLQDAELRYRQRYVDLWANPHVMKTLQLRMRIVEEVRAFMRSKGFLEVETPMLQPLHGGAAARPFTTHHNALDIKLFLRIAPELYLKRLLVGGFTKVFELNRNFRNEGISPRHNPEFTMLEAYEAFGNWETMADLVEEMITTIAQKVIGTLVIEHKDAEGNVTKTINLTRPWRRVRMVDLVEERTGWKFDKRPIQEAAPECFASTLVARVLAYSARWGDQIIGIIKKRSQEAAEDPEARFRLLKDIDRANVDEAFADAGGAKEWLKGLFERGIHDIETRTQVLEMFESVDTEGAGLWAVIALKYADNLSKLSPAEQLVEIYEKYIEPTLIDPCYVTHVPSVVIPLARENKEDPFFADVYELAINGQEISPGYTELNDADVQERHFRHQIGDKAEQQQVDEDFLNALRVGMPPAGGIGLGIDRLVMMLTGAESIRDVILFPLMRPQG
ncbi:MAG: amino acid--tRNA ligase-related protein [Phycisphaeraceae bacterium]